MIITKFFGMQVLYMCQIIRYGVFVITDESQAKQRKAVKEIIKRYTKSNIVELNKKDVVTFPDGRGVESIYH